MKGDMSINEEVKLLANADKKPKDISDKLDDWFRMQLGYVPADSDLVALMKRQPGWIILLRLVLDDNYHREYMRRYRKCIKEAENEKEN